MSLVFQCHISRFIYQWCKLFIQLCIALYYGTYSAATLCVYNNTQLLYYCARRGFSQSVFCVNDGGHNIVILPEVQLNK